MTTRGKMRVLALITVAIMFVSLFAITTGETIDAMMMDEEESQYDEWTGELMEKDDFAYDEAFHTMEEESEYDEWNSDAMDEVEEAFFGTMDEEDAASDYLLDILQAKANNDLYLDPFARQKSRPRYPSEEERLNRWRQKNCKYKKDQVRV